MPLIWYTTHPTIISEYSSCCRMTFPHITTYISYTSWQMKLAVLLNLLTFRQEERSLIFPVDRHYMNTPKRWFSSYYQTITHRKLQSKEPTLMSQSWALKSLDMPQLHRYIQPSFSPVSVIIVTQPLTTGAQAVFPQGSCFILSTGSTLFINERIIQYFGFSLLFSMQP